MLSIIFLLDINLRKIKKSIEKMLLRSVENKNNSKCIKKAAKYKEMGKSFNDSVFKFLTRISFLYLSFFWTTFEYCSLQTGGWLWPIALITGAGGEEDDGQLANLDGERILW